MTTTSIDVKERPIVFSGPMVRAIFEGRKTQTRRVIKPQPPLDAEIANPNNYEGPEGPSWWWSKHSDRPVIWPKPLSETVVSCPYGKIGLHLWVKEKYSISGNGVFYETETDGTVYIAWESPRFMPRKFSRITLEITDIRVQHVQEIDGEDALAEGVSISRCGCDVCQHSTTLCPADTSAAIEEYGHLWDSIYAKRGYGWAVNPFVWVISFRRI